ncbi:hypothetical protein J1N35_018758 [Gossypium stocksii]|uniref:Uncharacterized protein n=1 Tax=Gossypium stocksii TaxID=47602 RepID=A0A9D3VPK0_9ROSI|nr:hypothetical protein J1N35_018758 [Gossypium stocksii]
MEKRRHGSSPLVLVSYGNELSRHRCPKMDTDDRRPASGCRRRSSLPMSDEEEAVVAAERKEKVMELLLRLYFLLY